MKSSVIVGMGEIGSSLYKILKPIYPNTYGIDTDKTKNIDIKTPSTVDILHICIRYSDNFLSIVNGYILKYKPKVIDVCTTVPVGTTELISREYACHSTTRGLHPNLQDGLKTIRKHIGGKLSVELSDYFLKASVKCETHPLAKTTELLHILNNCHYGINLMFADEAQSLCRKYGVDYYDYMRYTESNNAGYVALGNPSKVRPILTPPNGKIGGHCLNMSAGLLEESDTDLIKKLKYYNQPKTNK